MKSFSTLLSAILLVVLLPASSLSQTKPPQTSSETTFVSRSELVLIPVIVRDKSGHHVSGLGKDDFDVLEDGKPRSLAMFEEIRTTGKIDGDRLKSEGTYSNFNPADEQPRRLLIIVFDMINTPFLQQARARQELIDFLSKSVNGDEPVALLILSRAGVKQIHSFTTDPRVLVAALKRVSGSVGSMETTQIIANQADETAFLPKDLKELTEEEQRLKEYKDTVQDTFARFQQKDNIRLTLQSMEEIANAYAGLPGRKSMLWATAGFPFLMDDPRALAGYDTSMVSSYERVWRTMNQANMAIYPVDLNGLFNYVYEDRFNPTNYRPGSRTPSMSGSAHQQIQDSMRSFANATGGTPCLEQNDLSRCFKIAAQDSEAYYMLGYYLGTESRKPGWHKLKVNVSGKSNQVRARSGFYVGDPKEIKRADLLTELGTALAAGVDYTGIHFDMKWGKVKESPSIAGKKHAEFDLSVLPSAISIDSGNNNHMNVEIAALVNNTAGKHVAEFARNLSADLKPESVEQIRKFGFRYRDRIELPAGRYFVKFVIRDNSTGKMGTVSAPLEVN